MFGHKSLPSRIYSYGANAPMENLDLVIDQMWKANGYRNNLAEVECGRRDKVNRRLRTLSPALAILDRKIAMIDAKIEECRSEIKRDHVNLFDKGANDPAKVTTITGLKEERQPLLKQRAFLRKQLFASRAWNNEHGPELDAWAKKKDHKYREASELYWGNYLHVDQSMGKRKAGPPPRFKPLDGGGHLAVQIQHGLSPEDALAGSDSRLKIVLGPVLVDGTRTAETGIKRKLGNAICYFRIGSNEDKDPIFAKIPFILHRPLPPDSMIKWVHLIRRRIGTKSEWRLQFVVSKKSWKRDDQAESGTVGIDLGWRHTETGLKIAVYEGSDGKTGVLELPEDWLGEMRRVEGITSVRDENLNDVKASLLAWMKEMSGKLPECFTTETQDLATWKSQRRLAGLVLKWRGQRMKGDEEIYFLLEEWRKRDKHLYEIEANLRDQLYRRRENLYRNFVAELRKRYKIARIVESDLRKVHEIPMPEDTPQQVAIKKNSRNACLSSLVRFLFESMTKVVEVKGKNVSRIHHECGAKQKLRADEVLHQCSKCGEIYDRDENAAKNILYGSKAA